MKLQLSLITTGITACTLASPVSASPILGAGKATLIRRSLSEWGIGHYGGTVSEIPKGVAEELELDNISLLAATTSETIDNASVSSASESTITPVPAIETPEPTTTEESITWSTTTLTVTATVTATPTETVVVAKVKRGEALTPDSEVSAEAGDVDELVTELNQFFTLDAIAVGDPCTPVAEIDYKICIGGVIGVCGAESWAWEVDTDCGGSGLVCGAIKVQDTVNGGFKGDIQCLEEDEIKF